MKPAESHSVHDVLFRNFQLTGGKKLYNVDHQQKENHGEMLSSEAEGEK